MSEEEQRRQHPADSLGGMAWLAATLVAVLLLSWGKRITGTRQGNPVLQTEARVTLVDSYLAAAVLVGLVLHAFLRWW